MKLLVSGAKGKKKRAHLPDRFLSDMERHHHGGAVLWLLDVESARFSTYLLPDEDKLRSLPHHAPPGPFTLDRFTGLQEFDGRYFVTTFNEVLVLEKDSGRLVDVYSQPSFNDLHCCYADEKGQVVANTGLDCLEFFDRNWKQINRIRFEEVRDIDGQDWRQIPSTKPHTCHLNWLFLLDGELWCTRFVNRDAIKVSDPSIRMNIDLGIPHDGQLRDGKVFFTTTNGRIVSHQANGSYQQCSVLRLEDIISPDRFGWVRGLYLCDDYLFVGTSKVRHTTSREVMSWIQGKELNPSNSSILQFRTQDMGLVAVLETPDPQSVVFSLLPV